MEPFYRKRLLTVLILLLYAHFGLLAQSVSYDNDALGSILTPFPQHLGEKPPSGYDPQDYLIDATPSRTMVIKVGSVVLRNGSFQYVPLVQPHMEVGWWTLTGNLDELRKQVKENTPAYCKLRGIQLQTRLYPRQGPMIRADRVSYYDFDVEETIWVKTGNEILSIRSKIDNLLSEANKEYRHNNWDAAFPLYAQAKVLAQEYLPNAITHDQLQRIIECEDLNSLESSSTAILNSGEYIQFLRRIANEEKYMVVGTNYDLYENAENQYIKVRIYDLFLRSLSHLSIEPKRMLETQLISDLKSKLEQNAYFSEKKKIFQMYEKTILSFAGLGAAGRLEKLRIANRL